MITAQEESPGRRIAVIQPYLFPYAGYFRLFAAADTVVLFDDVQFPRRGRVHRCELPGPSGRIEWLTLPLARQSRDVLIKDLAFAPDAESEWGRRIARLPWLAKGDGPLAKRLRGFLHEPLDSVVDFIDRGVRLIVEMLDLPAQIVRASDFEMPNLLRGQDRVIALVKAAGGECYVNPPGGRRLYQPEAFASQGVKLTFLAPYDGEFRYMLPALMSAGPDRLRRDVLRTTHLVA